MTLGPMDEAYDIEDVSDCEFEKFRAALLSELNHKNDIKEDSNNENH